MKFYQAWDAIIYGFLRKRRVTFTVRFKLVHFCYLFFHKLVTWAFAFDIDKLTASCEALLAEVLNFYKEGYLVLTSKCRKKTRHLSSGSSFLPLHFCFLVWRLKRTVKASYQPKLYIYTTSTINTQINIVLLLFLVQLAGQSSSETFDWGVSYVYWYEIIVSVLVGRRAVFLPFFSLWPEYKHKFLRYLGYIPLLVACLRVFPTKSKAKLH